MKIKISYSWEMYFQPKHARTPIKGVFIPRKDLPLVLIQQGGGNREPMILVRANTKKGYEVAEFGDSINLEYPNSTTRRGRVGKQIAQTITTSPQQGGGSVETDSERGE